MNEHTHTHVVADLCGVQVEAEWSFERVQALLRDVRTQQDTTAGGGGSKGAIKFNDDISFIYAGVRMEPSARLKQNNVLAGSTLYYLTAPRKHNLPLPQAHVDHDAGTAAGNELEARATAASSILRCPRGPDEDNDHLLQGMQVSRCECSACNRDMQQGELGFACRKRCEYVVCPECVIRLSEQQADERAPSTAVWNVDVSSSDADAHLTLAWPMAVPADSGVRARLCRGGREDVCCWVGGCVGDPLSTLA